MMLKKILRKTLRVFFLPMAYLEVNNLYIKEKNMILYSVINSLRDALKNLITEEEMLWINKIELLRNQLNKSFIEITITDYGASSHNSKKTQNEIRQGIIVRRTISNTNQSGVPYFWALILFKLIRSLRPLCCLELGTGLGISASYAASALKINQRGKLVTLEGAESIAFLAEQNFRKLGLDNVSILVGNFQDTLDSVLEKEKSIDYAFIDGHHDQKATLLYFEKILPYLSEKAIIIFDDISWSEGMRKAWRAINTDKRIKSSFDLYNIGICLVDKDIKTKSTFKIKSFRFVAY